jgi:hypothetical protein
MRRTDAVHEGGVLRPMRPLGLRPGEHVSLTIVRSSDPGRWNLDRLAAHPRADLDLARAGMREWFAALEDLDQR